MFFWRHQNETGYYISGTCLVADQSVLQESSGWWRSNYLIWQYFFLVHMNYNVQEDLLVDGPKYTLRTSLSPCAAWKKICVAALAVLSEVEWVNGPTEVLRNVGKQFVNNQRKWRGTSNIPVILFSEICNHVWIWTDQIARHSFTQAHPWVNECTLYADISALYVTVVVAFHNVFLSFMQLYLLMDLWIARTRHWGDSLL
jgi:hypothetical protein